jgi:L,D-transpeptidase-like protein
LLKRALPGVLVACIVATVPAASALGRPADDVHRAARVSASAKPVAPTVARPPSSDTSSTKRRFGSIDFDRAVAAGVSSEVLGLALQATACAAHSGAIEAPPATLTLIDYSKPSVEPRLWTFDLNSGELLFKELVAHGKNTGENLATRFSNEMESRQSSIGLFVTDEPYVGSNGYSLRLDGLDVGFNDRARARAIVMHGAPYVDADIAARQGRIGRSWGCPALPMAVAAKVIDRIRGGSVIFSYYPDQSWLKSSRFLQGCGAAS